MEKLNSINDRGLFFVVYGANNLGKSEQVRRLASRLIMEQHQVLAVKYPIYKLGPTGPKTNSILRDSNDPDRNISELDFQKLYAQNRRDFQSTLVTVLNSGVHVVAEDYTGTGLAWGLTRNVPLQNLETINAGLLQPDLAVLLDGERFTSAAEKEHRNEGDVDAIWDKNRAMHQFLAERYSWTIVNANQTMEKVHNDIIDVVQKRFADARIIKTTV